MFSTSRRSRSSSPDTGDIGRAGQTNRHAPLVRQHADGAPALGDDLVEIQVNGTQRVAAGVGAREDQHVVDQPAQSLRLADDNREGLAIFAFVAMLAAERDVCRYADDRHRSAELVRGVGHELPLRAQRIGDRAQADRGQVEAARDGDQQDDRNADHHRFLDLVLLTPDVGQRRRDEQDERVRLERLRHGVDAPVASR